MTEAKGFPYAGTYVGLAINKNVFSRLSTEWTAYKTNIDDLADNYKVIAFGTYSGIYILTNHYIDARVVLPFKLKDGKIICFE